MQRSSWLILGLTAALTFHAVGAPEPQELIDLRAKFSKAMERATEAMTIFWPAYKRHLEELKAKAQGEGNLDAVLAVEAEIKLADSQNVGKGAKYEPLKSLQAEYGELRRDLEKQIDPERRRLYGVYYAALESMEVSLTKESKLDDAVSVRTVMDRVKTQLRPNANAAGTAAAAPKQGGVAPKPANSEYVATQLIGHVGSNGPPYKDVGKNGALLVGFDLVITPFKKSNETVRGLTPIYRAQEGEVKGGSYGAEEGADSIHVVAKPGYAVGGLSVQYAVEAIRRVKVHFQRVNGAQLDPNDGYDSQWYGTYPDAKDGKVELHDKLPVGITGKAGRGLGCIGLLYANPNP